MGWLLRIIVLPRRPVKKRGFAIDVVFVISSFFIAGIN
jgi:hypothetical protein